MNKLDILYEDNHVIVVVKPCNILSQADVTKDLDIFTLTKQYIKEKYQKPGNVYLGLVHRLDRPTYGIMVMARTSKAAERLSKQVREHTLTKKYLAVVHGIPKQKRGTMKDYIEKVGTNSIISDSSSGKYAELSYQVLEENKEADLSLVEIELKTGRHHQIRVQFSHRGYPLFGDARYYRQEGQLCLVANELSFDHPITKKRMIFHVSPPKEMKGFQYFQKN